MLLKIAFPLYSLPCQKTIIQKVVYYILVYYILCNLVYYSGSPWWSTETLLQYKHAVCWLLFLMFGVAAFHVATVPRGGTGARTNVESGRLQCECNSYLWMYLQVYSSFHCLFISIISLQDYFTKEQTYTATTATGRHVCATNCLYRLWFVRGWVHECDAPSFTYRLRKCNLIGVRVTHYQRACMLVEIF